MIKTLLVTAAFAAALTSLPDQAGEGADAAIDPASGGLLEIYRDVPELRQDASPGERPELSSEPGTVVVLRGLDKVTARTRDFEIDIGDSAEFGALTITPRYCRKRPPEETPEIYAFVEVVDRRTDGFGVEMEGDTIFSGWMFASNPALNPLEHPVYDVWVIDCRA